MAEHTPGPWTVERDGQGNIVIGAPKPNDDARYLWIAEVTPSNNGEHEANARLIAAAPEMLEALRNAFASWFDNPRNFDKPEPNWVISARATIRAVEGGT